MTPLLGVAGDDAVYFCTGLEEQKAGIAPDETVAFVEQRWRLPGNRGFDESIRHVRELAAVMPLNLAPHLLAGLIEHDPQQMPGQRRPILSWPYVEGLRMDEAMHPLTLLATGLYGRALPAQNGAPLRLVVPWKYGFKSIKSIVRIRFTDTQPRTAWNVSAPNEYGFYANVNPEVDHPRWSQARERRIGEFRRRPTLMFNGYTEVASLYGGMDLRRYY